MTESTVLWDTVGVIEFVASKSDDILVNGMAATDILKKCCTKGEIIKEELEEEINHIRS